MCFLGVTAGGTRGIVKEVGKAFLPHSTNMHVPEQTQKAFLRPGPEQECQAKFKPRVKQTFDVGLRRVAAAVLSSVSVQLSLVLFLFCFSKSCEFVL